MPRHAFLIEYDGTPFHGWQRQAGDQPSVQAALEGALARIDPAGPLVQGAGRTDTGVHASGQVAHADLSRTWDPFRLAGALNAHLRPWPVAVLDCAEVPDDFHARFSAVERRYLYRIHCRAAPPVLARNQVWQVRHRLDVAAMRQAAANLIGRHDFTTFRSALCQAQSPVKTLDEISLSETPTPGGTEVRLTLRARSFLHNQVRSIVGTLERVGSAVWQPDAVAAALAARDRSACGPVAPACGLCLTDVRYPAGPFGG
ncbi:MAG: tRNA pseudouridine(38-40) synthase TruA [Gemmobacter sp.]